MSELTAYWIKSPRPNAPVGFGVTARSLREALDIIRVLGYGPMLPDNQNQIEVTAGVRIDQLGSDYVLSHMGPMPVRGMWYPFITLGIPRWAEEELERTAAPRTSI